MQAVLLEKVGMNTKQAKAYLSLLELGSAPAGTLAKKIDENRTSAYSLLNAMLKKGFVSYFEKRGIKYYVATDPRMLLEKNLSMAKTLFDYLPELLAIQNQHGQKPKITFYEGVEGIKQLCEKIMEVPGSTRDSFMGIDESRIHPEIKRYFEEDIINRRIEAGITYRGIVTGYLPMGNKYQKTEKDQLRELKWVDPEKFPIKIHIDIYPKNKVALYSYNKDEMMGVVIEHESFYITMKTAFALAWRGVNKD